MHLMMLAEAGAGAGGTDVGVVVDAIGTVAQVVGKVWDVVVGNPFLLFALGAGALGIGAKVFSKIKRSAG